MSLEEHMQPLVLDPKHLSLRLYRLGLIHLLRQQENKRQTDIQQNAEETNNSDDKKMLIQSMENKANKNLINHMA